MLPTLDVKGIMSHRASLRAAWEKDFVKNHKAFAENLSLCIAESVIRDFGNYLKNPYSKPSVFETTISLDITNSSTVKKLLSLNLDVIHPPRLSFSPFDQWLTTFSQGSKQTLSDVDTQFFMRAMRKVGEIAQHQLKNLFNQYITRPEHTDLQFHVSLQSVKRSDLSSDFTEDMITELVIKSWIK